jgi:Arc/MetJ-type ribon-helix-helix transcriptional regulator
MTVILTPDQERALQEAIQSGTIRSVDEFIETAIGALPHRQREFDIERARQAVARIRELRKGVRLDLHGMSLREFAHIGHNCQII